MSKFWKLTPTVALLTAIALLCAGVVMVLYIERSYKAQKVDEVNVQARILASTVTAALDFGDRQAAQEYVNALQANPEVEAAAIYDAGGAVFVGYARAADGVLPPRAPEGSPTFNGDRLTIVAPVIEGKETLGSVYLRVITEPIARRLERYGVIALLAIMAALLVAVLGVSHVALTRANAELEKRAFDLAAANRNLQAQILQREKAEEALRQAQKMEAIGQLTGGVAHDFNNLLQIILGNLDTARRRLQGRQAFAPEELQRRIEAALRGAERAATLTQRLLAFSRRQPLEPKPIDVNRLVAGMSDMMRRTLGEAVEIETVLAAGVWQISADDNQLESALLNLAVNSRDAMPDGGKLTIETANTQLDDAYAAVQDDIQPGHYVLIAVTDTGTGMTREALQKAFDPFFTTKDVGHGTGLGLSQVYGFVKQSGGHVKLYSEVGEGTTVKLYLPRLLAGERAAEPVEEASRFPIGRKDELILVVEDEPDVRAFTVAMLRELGYGVIEAGTGRDALAVLEENPEVRLLFTDVGLPGGLNGRQLADAARALRPTLKVLYTTGYARNAIVHHGRLDPGVQLVGKPFTYAALAIKIRAALEQDG